MSIVAECHNHLLINNISTIATVHFDKQFNYDGSEKDIVGDIIYTAMANLHHLRFGLFTDDTLERVQEILKQKIIKETHPKVPYVLKSSLSMNVLGLLDTIVRLFINFDQRFSLQQ